MAEQQFDNTKEIAGTIVSSYLSNNQMSADQVPGFIKGVIGALKADGAGEEDGQGNGKQTPAVPIKRSVTDDHVICLMCGRKMKALKRHIAADHGMSPDEYRKAFQLPIDHPLVSRDYSRKRSQMAKDLGLGRKAAARTKSAKKAQSRKKTAAKG